MITHMSLPHLILGALNQKAMSGYDLNKYFQASAGLFWSTDQSQIYRALHRLRDQGLVESQHIIQGGHPNKDVYSLTEAGQDALQKWLRTPLGESETPVREGWLGQLFFGHMVDPQELCQILDVYIERRAGRVRVLQNILRHNFEPMPEATRHLPQVRLQELTVDYGITLQRAELEWLKHARRQIQLMDETNSDHEA